MMLDHSSTAAAAAVSAVGKIFVSQHRLNKVGCNCQLTPLMCLLPHLRSAAGA
jgi:hypothetical protein